MKKKDYQEKYWEKNKLALIKKNAKYREENKEFLSKNKKKYYLKNREEILLKSKIYHEQNKEKINKRRKEYREKNRIKIAKQKREYQKKLHNTINGKLMHNIRQSIRRSLSSKGYTKKFASEKILGCSIEEFKKYLESKFEPWMSWKNKGLYNGEFNYGWDIDHIVSLSTAETEENIIKLNHYTNLQPLCSKINRDIKKNKIL